MTPTSHHNRYMKTLFQLYNAEPNNSGINPNPCTLVSISELDNSKLYKHLLFLALPSLVPVTLTLSLHNKPNSDSDSFHLSSTSPLYFKSEPSSFTLYHHYLAAPCPFHFITVILHELWSSSPSHHLLVTSGTSHAKSFIFLIGLANRLLFTRRTFPLDCLQISTTLAELWKLELLNSAVLCKISIHNTFYWSNALATCSGMRRWISDWKFHKNSFQKLN